MVLFRCLKLLLVGRLIIETNSLPTTIVLSKSGKIVIKKTGAASWNSKKVHEIIDQLLLE